MDQIQVIELDEHDDIHTIRDRLATAQSQRVMLVVPWDSPVLRRTVDLQVVPRFAAWQDWWTYPASSGIMCKIRKMRSTIELGGGKHANDATRSQD